jgi:hypothetical protein
MDLLGSIKYIEEADMIVQIFVIEDIAWLVKYTKGGRLLGVSDIKVFIDI